MSELYSSIPPERELAYLQHAQEAANEAQDVVIGAMALQTMVRVNRMNTLDAHASTLADEAEQFLKDNQLGDKFMEEMEKPRESDIVKSAEQLLHHEALIAQGYREQERAPESKHYKLKKAKTPSELEAVLDELRDDSGEAQA